ncbi:hypothetical protein ABZ922_41620 [Streptomyces shenzhenensis]|uniref:hypothetical protein n=1 Tax=Streptomyces shenzhenensis TaxID=943815 RepID=UPI0033F86BE4
MRLGIILGGGGEVGIAWETAVLAALTEHAGLDATKATAIAGNSAGAFVAALAATGHNLSDLTQREIAGHHSSPAPDLPTQPSASTATGTSAVPEDITRIVTSTSGTPSTARPRSANSPSRQPRSSTKPLT